MKKTVLATCAVFAALMISCGTGKQATAPYFAGEWDIVSVKGTNVDTAKIDKTPFIGFDRVEKRIFGSASCNRFFAGLELDSINSKIKFGMPGATRMMCPNMEIEDAILSTLDKITSYKSLENGDVQLSDENGNSMMVIRKK